MATKYEITGEELLVASGIGLADIFTGLVCFMPGSRLEDIVAKKAPKICYEKLKDEWKHVEECYAKARTPEDVKRCDELKQYVSQKFIECIKEQIAKYYPQIEKEIRQKVKRRSKIALAVGIAEILLGAYCLAKKKYLTAATALVGGTSLAGIALSKLLGK